MSQKKCPKCGEDNPLEAVMCWACYTPLTATATAAATAAGAPINRPGPSRVGPEEVRERKPIPPLFMGLGGLVVLALIVLGISTLWSATPPVIDNIGVPPPTDTGQPPAPGPVDPGYIPPAPSPGQNPGNTNPGGTVGPEGPQFTIAAAPNPKMSEGTMAILAKDANLGAPQAAALAKFTRRSIVSNSLKRWSRLYIYVFTDAQAAQQFSEYQAANRGRPLREADYLNLINVWSRTLVRYEYSGYNRSERTVYPYLNPGGWWRERRR